MTENAGDVATTMDEIFNLVVDKHIGPNGFGKPSVANEWLMLDAQDCRNQIELCRAWIRTQGRTKTIRPGVHAADYMHTVERYANHLIHIGAFLAAAYLEGVSVKRRGSDANFNIRINRLRNVL